MYVQLIGAEENLTRVRILYKVERKSHEVMIEASEGNGETQNLKFWVSHRKELRTKALQYHGELL